jgi:hypothetical protein
VSGSARLIERIQSEYEALPSLKLTVAQACRLWSADEASCQAALDTLVSKGVLWRTPSGRYVALPSPGGVVATIDPVTVRCPHCQKRNAVEIGMIGVAIRCQACHRVFTVAA